MNSNRLIAILTICFLSVILATAAEITKPDKFGKAVLLLAIDILQPQGIENKIISEGWKSDFQSKNRMALLIKYDDLICTPLEDSPQSRKWAKEIFTVLTALAFLSEDFGGREYLQLGEYHIKKALTPEEQALYKLLNYVLEYWLRMKSFQYQESKGVTEDFLNAIKKLECKYEGSNKIALSVKNIKKLIKQ